MTNQNNSLQITKTDYLNFRFCRKNLWLQKNRPDEFGRFSLSEFELELVKEGQEVDKEAQNLWPDGIVISGDQEVAIKETEKFMLEKKTLFQAAILHELFYIRTDVIKWNEKLDGWELYEVKATTKVKEEKFNNHIYDLAFQYNICRMAGIEIKKISVTHLNAKYKKDGDLDYSQLFQTDDVTEKVLEIADAVKEEIALMVDYLTGPEEKFCQCRYRPRNAANHCTTFDYSNPDVPEYSVHDITRINKNKLAILIDDGLMDIKSVPSDFKLSDSQRFQVSAAERSTPIIDTEAIQEFFKDFEFPLYFIDYESYLPAIPWFNRYGPYQNIVFQYSLHVLEKAPAGDDWSLAKAEAAGDLQHYEFLATETHEPSKDLVEAMRERIGDKGTILVWHKPFEKGRNEEMGQLNPKYAKFLEEMNERIVDLKEVFSKNMYVDSKFKGSASIKKVLPVLVPELSYADLPINNGADANKQWGRMLKGEVVGTERDEIIKNLLVYCKQDTFAMVKIYEELWKLL